MALLPSALGLTQIPDGSKVIAADHRNNYASIQATINQLITLAANSGAFNPLVTGDISVQAFLAVGDGVTDDHLAFVAAIAAASATGGGRVVVPFTTNGYNLGANVVSVPANVSIVGTGGSYVRLVFAAGGGLKTTGTVGVRSSYNTFENLLLESATRHTCTLLDVEYTDVVLINQVRCRFSTIGILLNNSTGVEINRYDPYDCQYGLQALGGCGGLVVTSCAFNSCELDVLLNGSANGATFVGCQLDTDADQHNGAASQGAVSVTGGWADVTFVGCQFNGQFWNAAAPTLGAVVALDGCQRVQFLNCIFDSLVAGTHAAPFGLSTTGSTVDFQVIGGRSRNAGTAFISNAGVAAAGVLMFVDSAEATVLGGANPNAVGVLAISASGGIQMGSSFFGNKIGFYGKLPVAQAAHPVTLADVITLLTNLGLSG